ncbi:alpha/beta hydrolase fold domain-containing protein [Nannocystaceae bacterium ST9]
MSEGFAPRRAGAAKLRRKLAGLDLGLPIEQQREGFARLLALTEIAMPDHASEWREIGGIAALWIDASGSPQREPLVHLHGGGYSLGSPQTHRPLAARLSRRLARPVLLPRYRQPPEHPCPAALADVLAFWRDLGESSTRVLSGDSAGGGLALALAMALRDAGERLPAAMVLLSPWTDLSLSGVSIDAQGEADVFFRRPGLELMAGRYAGGIDRRDARVSPLWGDLGGLPAMLIQAGADEALLDDSTRLAERVRGAGGVVELQIWPGQGHVFQATPMLSAAGEAIEAIAEWVGH